MRVEKLLENYKQNKSLMETTLARIQAYKDKLKCNDLESCVYVNSYNNLGMPKAPLPSNKSIVEAVLVNSQLNADVIQQWIKEDQSRIWFIILEVEQIEAAMGALQESERFIIECKYFEKMFWRNIEYAYNNKFRDTNTVTTEMLRKMCKEALDKLDRILDTFFKQWRIT